MMRVYTVNRKTARCDNGYLLDVHRSLCPSPTTTYLVIRLAQGSSSILRRAVKRESRTAPICSSATVYLQPWGELKRARALARWRQTSFIWWINIRVHDHHVNYHYVNIRKTHSHVAIYKGKVRRIVLNRLPIKKNFQHWQLHSTETAWYSRVSWTVERHSAFAYRILSVGEIVNNTVFICIYIVNGTINAPTTVYARIATSKKWSFLISKSMSPSSSCFFLNSFRFSTSLYGIFLIQHQKHFISLFSLQSLLYRIIIMLHYILKLRRITAYLVSHRWNWPLVPNHLGHTTKM